MCGIVGLVSSSLDAAAESRSLDSAITCLAHRGPDGSGSSRYQLANSTSVYFGHTRLAIIDLSDEGLQPFESKDGKYSLTYNGEIYNYRELRSELEGHGVRFLTSSDTEVLLEALIFWGVGALEKLEGMFAFGFLDLQKRELLLARDPFGVKPMLYSTEGSKFAFASEARSLKSLLPTKHKLNRDVAARFLLFGDCERNDGTFTQDITHLPPGNYLIIDLEKGAETASPVPYWIPRNPGQADISLEKASVEFRHLFLESVGMNLRSDVPIGAALSGGLDSSSIVGAMRHLSPSAEIHTFSFIDRSTQLSEERWVDLATDFNGAIPHKIFLDSNSFFDKDLDGLVLAQSEPFPDLSVYSQFKVFEAAAHAGITVTLDGQGADELLAGYWGFPESRLHSLLEKGDIVGVVRFIKNWLPYPGRSIRALLGTAFATYFPQVRRSESFIRTSTRFGVMGDHSLELFAAEAIQFATSSVGRWGGARGNQSRRLIEALASALGPQRLTSLLRYSDRNSMAFSVESRVPFLSRKLTEFTLSLPEEYLLSPGGETKHILRQALVGLVPSEILNRRDKIGFEAGTKKWGFGSEKLRGIANNIGTIPLINEPAVRNALLGVVDGKVELNSNLWRVLSYVRWMQLTDTTG